MSRFAVILPAAGKSDRFGDPNYKKQFAPLANRPVWLHAAEKFLNRHDVCQVVVVIAPEDREYFDFKFASNVTILNIDVVEGGSERADSVERGLSQIGDAAEFVCIHDAARPCLADDWIDRVFAAAQKTGAAILAWPIAGTIKRVAKGQIEETVPRLGLWEAQTPQVFRRELLAQAFAQRAGFQATDEAQLVERLGQPVAVVEGSPLNIKIARRQDLKLAEQVLKVLPKPRLDRAVPSFADDDLWR